MRVPGAVTTITHACEVRRRCVDFVARHECGERLQLRVFARKIQAGEADGWLGANAEELAIQTKTSRRCAPGGTGGLTRPATKTARPSSQYNALIVVPSASKLQGPRSRFNVRYLPGECALRRKAMCDRDYATRDALERDRSNSQVPVCSGCWVEHAFQACIPKLQKKDEASAAEVRDLVTSAAEADV
jgi:hypothetical protein